MENPKIQIMVMGVAGTGKTVIARLLEEFLLEKGFDVDRELGDNDIPLTEEEHRKRAYNLAVDSGLEISIVEKQLSRGVSASYGSAFSSGSYTPSGRWSNNMNPTVTIKNRPGTPVSNIYWDTEAKVNWDEVAKKLDPEINPFDKIFKEAMLDNDKS